MSVSTRLTESDIEDLAEALVDRIRRRPSQRYTTVRLAEKFSVAGEDIERALEILRQWGYQLQRGSGWCQFRRAPDALLAGELRYKLGTKTLGSQLHAYAQVRSTIDIARRLAEEGAPEGTLVVADKQSAGRGRLGRSWHSPAGVGAYLSVILRPDIEPSAAPALSLITGLAYAEAVSALTDLEAQVKWPNDVLWRGRKIAGILTELATRRDRVSFVIVSAGMNLNHTREQFPAELRGKASSLRIALRHKVNRVAVAQEFLRRLERRYSVFLKRGFNGVRRAVCKRSTLLGKSVIIEEPTGSGQRLSGLAVDIDGSGRLVVETSLGEIRLLSGEVSLEQTYES